MRIVPAVAALWVAASPLGAQTPPDSASLPDTLVVTDTAGLAEAALATPADTVPDSLRVEVLPEAEGRAPAGIATGVWVVEREALLPMRGLSLADLLAQLPGMVRLRGGDYGAPETVTAFGLAGGGIRVFWDGFEQVPLAGAVVDLARIGLGGVERVRVERHPTELRIHLASLRDHDGRPLSLIEAGTGDFDTNFFRGTFVHPRALGGSLGLTLDRIDTDGPGGDEDGSRSGGWLRWTRHLGDDLAFTAEARRMKSAADIPDYPGTGSRTDWVVRGRWRAADGLVLQGFTGRTNLDGLAEEGRLEVDRSRAQHGLLADLDRGPFRAAAAFRLLGGAGVPSSALDLSATADLPALGGATASLSRESWDGEGATLLRATAWTRPLLGLSLFGGWESGDRGAALHPRPSLVPEEPAEGEDPVPPEPEPDPGARITHRSALRLGAVLGWRGLRLSGARVSLETESLSLLGLPMDRDGLVLPGVERTGFEVEGWIPLGSFLPDGFALTGSLTTWDEGARYLPERAYQARLVFHDLFYPTGNLEVWGSLGVEGRGPMLVPLGDPEDPERAAPLSVPFQQSWHAFIQARVVSVRVFVAWDNFTVRRNNQDFPGRVLPIYRTTYGVRWTLWN